MERRSYIRFGGAVLMVAMTSVSVLAETVKLSRSGICHDSGSASYERTTRFTPYPDLQSCLDAGGRLPRAHRQTEGHGSSSATRGQGYDRELYPHWLDVDGDGCDTRAEVLIAASETAVTRSGRCTVRTGRWHGIYGDRYWTLASDLDVDHIVPLAWAHAHGADTWSRNGRAKFANDPDNLIAVEDNLNQQKSASGPDQWLPPNRAYQCQYLIRFVRVVQQYRLTLSPQEQRRYRRIAENVCTNPLEFAYAKDQLDRFVF